jgi:hypothetical protein
LGVRDVLKNFALEELGEDSGPLGAAGGAEASSLTGKSDEKLEAALWTNDAGEAGFEESAVKVREDGGIPVASPESITSLETLFPQALEGLEVGLEEWIEGAGAGIAGPVSGRAGKGPRRKAGASGDSAHTG